MKLCIDVGNTTIVFGFYNEDKLINKLVLATSIDTLQDEYYAKLKLLLTEKNIDPSEVSSIMYSSVVPSINEILFEVINALFINAITYELDSSSPHEIKMEIDNPKEVGSDLIADLVAAKAKYPLPLVVIDFGTATKLLLLDKNGNFTSALIMPGVEVSAKSLFSKAALLPEVDLSNYKNLLNSKNTIDCIKHGILFGHLESIKGLCDRYENELGYKLNKVITGGSSIYYKDLFSKDYLFDENLVIDGELIVLNKYQH